MSKLFFVTTALLLCAFVMPNQMVAQKKFKFTPVSRDVKKEARKYEKDGFSVLPGRLPITQQLDDAYSKLKEEDDMGFPKYVVANGSSVANSQSAAQMQALELAKQNLVSLLETNMRSVIENEVGNNQLSSIDAASITKTMQVSVNKVSKKLSRVMELFVVYKNLPNKNTEVQLMVGYSYALAQQAILDEMKLAMQAEAEDMKVKYESFLNPELYKQGEIKNFNEAK